MGRRPGTFLIHPWNSRADASVHTAPLAVLTRHSSSSSPGLCGMQRRGWSPGDGGAASWQGEGLDTGAMRGEGFKLMGRRHRPLFWLLHNISASLWAQSHTDTVKWHLATKVFTAGDVSGKSCQVVTNRLTYKLLWHLCKKLWLSLM